MLVLSRRVQQSVHISDSIVVRVLSIKGTRVQLGISALTRRAHCEVGAACRIKCPAGDSWLGRAIAFQIAQSIRTLRGQGTLHGVSPWWAYDFKRGRSHHDVKLRSSPERLVLLVALLLVAVGPQAPSERP